LSCEVEHAFNPQICAAAADVNRNRQQDGGRKERSSVVVKTNAASASFLDAALIEKLV